MTNQFFKTKIEEAERNASCKDDAELYYRGLSFAYGKSEQAVKKALLKIKKEIGSFQSKFDVIDEDCAEIQITDFEVLKFEIDKIAKEAGIDVEDKK
jgi:hypothetical protein